MRPILALCLALAAVPAHATVVTTNFSGTIDSASDTGNLFGGGSLAGDTLSATISYDTSQLNYNLQSGYEYYTGGGSNFLLSVSINGFTVNQTVSVSQIVAQSAGSDTEFNIDGFSPNPTIEFLLYALQPWVAGTINQPFELDSTRSQLVVVSDEAIFFHAAASETPVPEPASAFLLGTGLIALGVKRRRKAA